MYLIYKSGFFCLLQLCTFKDLRLLSDFFPLQCMTSVQPPLMHAASMGSETVFSAVGGWYNLVCAVFTYSLTLAVFWSRMLCSIIFCITKVSEVAFSTQMNSQLAKIPGASDTSDLLYYYPVFWIIINNYCSLICESPLYLFCHFHSPVVSSP